VNVRVVVPFNEILGAPNALAIAGGATTIRLAVAVRPVPPSFEVTALVTLALFPAVVPITLIAKLHPPLEVNVAPDRLTLPLPATAVIVPAPHVPVSPLGVATTTPAGNASVKPMPVKVSVAFGLARENDNGLEPFSGMLGVTGPGCAAGRARAGPEKEPKIFWIVGGPNTVTLALEVFPVPPSMEVTMTLLF